MAAARRPAEERHYSGSFEFDPGEGYTVEPFTPDHREDVLAMWAREDAMPAEVAALVGVATAYLNEPPPLRVPLWTPRLFIAREHRAGLLGLALAVRLVGDCEEAFVSAEDNRAPGGMHV